MKRQEIHISHEGMDIFSKKQNKSPKESKMLAKLKEDVRKGEILFRLIMHALLRTEDLFDRINLIGWIQNKFERKDYWKDFRPLLIKDFHIDVSSLMDSVAAFIIQMTAGIKSEHKERLPGFSHLLQHRYKKNEYRKEIEEKHKDIILLIDSTEENWWNINVPLNVHCRITGLQVSS